MEQLQRQQQARLEMERKERHLREAQIMYAQQVAAQQAILAAARASGTPLGATFLGKDPERGTPGGGQPVHGPNQSNMNPGRNNKEDLGRDSQGEEDEERQMEADEGSEEEDDDEEEERSGEGAGGLEYLRKQSLALQQSTPHPPTRPYPHYAPSALALGPRSVSSLPVKVKQEPEEESLSPGGPPSSTSPNGQGDWSSDEQFKQQSILGYPIQDEAAELGKVASDPWNLNEQPADPCTYNGSTSWSDEVDGGRGRGEASRDFAKLYELDSDPKRKEFLDDLFAYMQKRGTPVNRIPIMAKQVLDLYMLYKLVTEKGGLVEVINKKMWREITKGLNLPTSITSAAFTLRTQYMKYLYPYECEKKGLSSPGELQAAIDSNRREGRRPGYSASLYRFPSSPSASPHILSSPKMHLASLGGGTSSGHNGLQASPGSSLKKGADEGSSSSAGVSRSPLAMALGTQPAGGLVRAATLGQLRERLETSEGPERKAARLAEEQQRLMQQALQHNLLAMAAHTPVRVRPTATREDKQDLAVSINTNGAASISVSVEVNGTVYSGMLFAQKPTVSAAASPAPSAGGFAFPPSAHSPSPSSSSKGASSIEPSASSSP
ncbi:AT-rich interactive domain-containing protein 3B-like [Scleropages formosus]|uniref:AT-rich interactive domain-containing protein 3 n=1 Tax=Scleropages formosus TaxID=113540 RepID=A0A0P7VVM1_SCLFO|nr:AT-rich interactive domain-containing protein 3B-like [Scleropages formosus]